VTLGEALAAITEALTGLGAPFAVVGGMAVSARAEPRFTRDVDVAVAVGSDVEAESLIHSLTARAWSVVGIVEQDVTGRLAQARLSRADDDDPVVCDLLLASSGIEDLVVVGAEPLEVLPGVVLPVARRSHLIALKLLSVDERRLQDRIDPMSLVAGAAQGERDEVEEAVAMIMSRGMHRGRDLVRAVQELPWAD
jgi:hypothetical protein